MFSIETEGISIIKDRFMAWMSCHCGLPDTKLQNETGRVGKSVTNRRRDFTGKLTLWLTEGCSQRDNKNGRGRFLYIPSSSSQNHITYKCYQSKHCPSHSEEEG